MNWKEYISVRRNKYELFLSLLTLAFVLVVLTNFLNYIENRPGAILSDPVLSLFNPIDLTWIIFGLIYISLIAAIISFARNPEKLLFAIQLYTLMVTVRIIAMYLLPLEPPETMIILKDPFVEFFGTGQTLTKDLFFSGHTATLLIIFIIEENKLLKSLFLICTVLVAISVILQHVHYTIDVFGAVFFTSACYFIIKELKQKLVLI